MTAVHVRYWAGAARAAGRKDETVQAGSVAELRAVLGARPELASVSRVASLLVDGQQVPDDAPLRDGVQVDVLPPFAGGRS